MVFDRTGKAKENNCSTVLIRLIFDKKGKPA